MSPPRTPYRAPRRRREIFFAVIGVTAVLVFTGVMLWVLAPESEEPAPVPPALTTLPLPDPSASTVPGAPTDSSVTTVPAESTTPSTVPPG